MKQINILLVALLIGINAFSQDTFQSSAEFIRNFNREYVKMFQIENFELIQESCGDSIRIMPEFQKTIFTKENANQYYQAFFDRFDVNSYSRGIYELLDLGNRIIELGHFSMSISVAENQYELQGKYLNIWKLDATGQPTLITESWNYDHGVDFSDQLRFEQVKSVRMALEPHLAINDHISFELSGLNALMELVISEKDGRLWSMFYADDGMSYHSFSPRLEGRKELDKYFEMHAREMPVFEKLDVRTDRIDELNNYVIEYATAIANWRFENSSGISTSKNIRLWKRQPNGSLKIYRMIAMYD